jgi:chaperonin cofactor prefoldin
VNSQQLSRYHDLLQTEYEAMKRAADILLRDELTIDQRLKLFDGALNEVEQLRDYSRSFFQSTQENQTEIPAP